MAKLATPGKPKSQIRQERIMTYFIEAADTIIRDEGIRGVTIRKTADLAGYTSATLYNYFDDLSHLTYMAAMHHLHPYYNALNKTTRWCKNSLERYLSIAECFTIFCFSEPEIYKLLFFTYSGENIERYTKQYYLLFPPQIPMAASEPLSRFFNINNIHERSKIQLVDCIDEGFFTEQLAEDFNNISLMMFKCILDDVHNEQTTYEEAVVRSTRYYCQLIRLYTRKEKQEEIDASYQRLREHATDFLKEVYVQV